MVWPTLEEIDMAWYKGTVSFPYIPGLLTFDQRVTSGDYCSTPLLSAVRRPRLWEGTRRWKTCGGPLRPFSIRAEKWARH